MKSNDLFELVKSLGKSEKRFFKLNAALHSGERNSLKLFDAISEMKEYDEPALRKKFRKEKFSGYFSRAKNELYTAILESMNVYSRHSPGLRLKEQVNGIRFLYDKGLYEQALKQSQRARKMALKFSRPIDLLEVLNWQKKIYRKKNLFHFDTDLFSEESDLLATLADTNICWGVNYQIARRRAEKGRSRDLAATQELKALLDKMGGVGKDRPLSWEGKYFFLRSHFSVHDQKADWPEAIRHLEEMIKHFESNPLMATEYMEEFTGTYYNYLNLHLFLKKFDAPFRQKLETFKSIPARYFDAYAVPWHLQVKFYTIYYQAQLNLAMTKSDFSEAERIIPEMHRHLEGNPGLITREEKLVCYINFSIVCYEQQNYTAALTWVNRILNDPAKDLRSDVYSFARVFNLILHFELKHFDYLEYQMRSIYRFLNKKNLFYKLENKIFYFIKKTLSLSGEKEIRIEREKLYEALQEMAKNPEEKAVFSSFDFVGWVKKGL